MEPESRTVTRSLSDDSAAQTRPRLFRSLGRHHRKPTSCPGPPGPSFGKSACRLYGRGWYRPGGTGGRARSEEHTSELQSLMRISYAVFCLKKKKHKTI